MPNVRKRLRRPLDWTENAACGSANPEMFSDPSSAAEVNWAKAVCRTCPGRAACLEYALANDERYGIWGGCDPEERKALRTVA